MSRIIQLTVVETNEAPKRSEAVHLVTYTTFYCHIDYPLPYHSTIPDASHRRAAATTYYYSAFFLPFAWPKLRMVGANDLDVVRQAELPLERTARDALIEIRAIAGLSLLAGHDQLVRLGRDQ